jgi:hypothetical protein
MVSGPGRGRKKIKLGKVMEDTLHRIVENLFGRLDGPLHFRFVFQPLMAIIYAVIDGIRDAKNGSPPYFWSLFTNPRQRKEFIKDGWKHVGKIFIFAVVLDVVYSLLVYHRLYPTETLIVSICLAIIPYLLFRGPVNRLMRMVKRKHA